MNIEVPKTADGKIMHTTYVWILVPGPSGPDYIRGQVLRWNENRVWIFKEKKWKNGKSSTETGTRDYPISNCYICKNKMLEKIEKDSWKIWKKQINPLGKSIVQNTMNKSPYTASDPFHISSNSVFMLHISSGQYRKIFNSSFTRNHFRFILNHHTLLRDLIWRTVINLH